nr:MAG TPA: hypothetical protein [Crassvirales sp.]
MTRVFINISKPVEISKRSLLSSCDVRHDAVSAYTFVL